MENTKYGRGRDMIGTEGGSGRETERGSRTGIIWRIASQSSRIGLH